MSNRVIKKVFGDSDLQKVSPDSEDEKPVSFGASGNRLVRNPYELVGTLTIGNFTCTI